MRPLPVCYHRVALRILARRHRRAGARTRLAGCAHEHELESASSPVPPRRCSASPLSSLSPLSLALETQRLASSFTSSSSSSFFLLLLLLLLLPTPPPPRLIQAQHTGKWSLYLRQLCMQGAAARRSAPL